MFNVIVCSVLGVSYKDECSEYSALTLLFPFISVKSVCQEIMNGCWPQIISGLITLIST